MNKEDEAIVEFCSALALVRERFRAVHICLEQKPFLRQVTTTVSHARGNFNEALLRGRQRAGEQAAYGVEISYSLDAELPEPIASDKYSLGASIAIRSLGGRWLLQAEVGWSCKSCGWEEHQAFEREAATAREVVIALPGFCDEVLSCYKTFVDSHGAK